MKHLIKAFAGLIMSVKLCMPFGMHIHNFERCFKDAVQSARFTPYGVTRSWGCWGLTRTPLGEGGGHSGQVARLLQDQRCLM